MVNATGVLVVSILVVLDQSLRPPEEQREFENQTRFNPCCFGSVFETPKLEG